MQEPEPILYHKLHDQRTQQRFQLSTAPGTESFVHPEYSVQQTKESPASPKIQKPFDSNMQIDSQANLVEQRRSRSHETTKMDRTVIQAALAAGIPAKEICQKYKYTRRQVEYAKSQPLDPGKNRCGTKPAISKTKALQLVDWLHSDPQNRFVPYNRVPDFAPELDLHRFGVKSIRRAFKSQGYERRAVKVFSRNSPQPTQMRLDYILSSHS
ncbi:hypothetical protein K3495_g691 [Podosphaera aphanis]|nr:hypothetical protein K3495_g691 [Podosphaera aphanis]